MTLSTVPQYGAKLVGEVVYDAVNKLGCETFIGAPSLSRPVPAPHPTQVQALRPITLVLQYVPTTTNH